MKHILISATILVSLMSCQSEVEKLQETEKNLWVQYDSLKVEQKRLDSIVLNLQDNWEGDGSIYLDPIYTDFDIKRDIVQQAMTDKLKLINEVIDKQKRIEAGLE
jgi:hypothetical protein